MKAFFTGSRVYGEPHEESDFDLVVLVDKEEHSLILDMVDDDGVTLRVDSLNFILLRNTDDGKKQFEIWKKTTEELKAIKPVKRLDAVKAFVKAGVNQHDYGFIGLSDEDY